MVALAVSPACACAPACVGALGLCRCFGFALSVAQGVKVVLYFIGMIWAFGGVGILADTFMAAIEQITAREAIQLDDQGNQTFIKVCKPKTRVSQEILLRYGFW